MNYVAFHSLYIVACLPGRCPALQCLPLIALHLHHSAVEYVAFHSLYIVACLPGRCPALQCLPLIALHLPPFRCGLRSLPQSVHRRVLTWSMSSSTVSPSDSSPPFRCGLRSLPQSVHRRVLTWSMSSSTVSPSDSSPPSTIPLWTT